VLLYIHTAIGDLIWTLLAISDHIMYPAAFGPYLMISDSMSDAIGGLVWGLLDISDHIMYPAAFGPYLMISDSMSSPSPVIPKYSLDGTPMHNLFGTRPI